MGSRGVYSYLTHSAKKRNIEWNLSREDVFFLISQNCYYCGVEPQQKFAAKHLKHKIFLWNGIDRKDSSLGYTLENVVPCCGWCNRAKGSRPLKEFMSWIKRISKKVA